MKVTDIVNEQTPVNRRSPIDQMPLGFGGGGAGGGSPVGMGGAGQAGSRVTPMMYTSRDPSTGRFTSSSTSPAGARQTYSPTTGQTAVPKQTQSMGRSLDASRYFDPPPAPGEKFAVPAAAAIVGAPLAATALLNKGREPTPPAGTSTPPTSPSTLPAGSSNPPSPAARPAVPAPVARPARGPQQGRVGAELSTLSGGEFASRDDRLNQAKVDSILGTGYKAGSAEANMALVNHYRQQASSSSPALGAVAGSPPNLRIGSAAQVPPGANPAVRSAAISRDAKAHLDQIQKDDARRQELAQQIFNQNMERASQQLEKDLIKNYPGPRTEPAGSDNSTVTVPEDKNQLMRLLKLSGQR